MSFDTEKAVIGTSTKIGYGSPGYDLHPTYLTQVEGFLFQG